MVLVAGYYTLAGLAGLAGGATEAAEAELDVDGAEVDARVARVEVGRVVELGRVAEYVIVRVGDFVFAAAAAQDLIRRIRGRAVLVCSLLIAAAVGELIVVGRRRLGVGVLIEQVLMVAELLVVVVVVVVEIFGLMVLV